ncbi:alpha/beta fold hydrolase [Spirosoma terrae]|nr:alpha/beta hydrolase [Spirosoma terrae]
MKTIKQFFVFLLVTGIAVGALAQRPTIRYGSNAGAGNFVSIRGFRMYYEVYGSGKPLLLIHGNGGSIKDFQHQISYFARNYKVIVADSRAQGKSVDTSDTLTYEMMADDLNALLTTLRVDSCYVIGWSDGGINGLLLAMRHPEKVKKLAITGTNTSPDTTALDPVFFRWMINANDSLAKLPQTRTVKDQQKLLTLMMNNPHISSADLKQVNCPTLVIGGDHDVIPVSHTMAIAQAIPQAYLWILPNSGHSTLITYKAMFNQVVSDFFNRSYRSIKGMARLD